MFYRKCTKSEKRYDSSKVMLNSQSSNIKAAGALYHIHELGENIGIFRIVDAAVRHWANGAFNTLEATAVKKFKDYWQRANDRFTPEERGMVYQRVLGKGDVKVLDPSVVNKDFPILWNNLMTSVADFLKTDRMNDGAGKTALVVPHKSICQATKALQNNLSEYCTGMDLVKIRELNAQLQDCFDIIRDEGIMTHFGGSRHKKSMWAVIEEISRHEFGFSPDIQTRQNMAVNGNKVFQWIADFNESAVTNDQFDAFLLSAESWIMAAASAEADTQWLKDESDSDDFDAFDDFNNDTCCSNGDDDV